MMLTCNTLLESAHAKVNVLNQLRCHLIIKLCTLLVTSSFILRLFHISMENKITQSIDRIFQGVIAEEISTENPS